jgi:VanZ family protein
MGSHATRSSARSLAAVYAVLVVYATLHPFDGWRWPPGVQWAELAALPWPRWRNRFDEWSNFAGYLPFGALLFVARVRGGARSGASLAWAIVLPAAWSFLLEVLQGFIPSRVPSARDWALNSAGAAVGAGLAALLHRWGALRRWHDWRARWLGVPSGGGLALLLLWPVALLFPAPLPLGLGQWFSPLQELLAVVLEDTPWAGLLSPEPESAASGTGLGPLAEVLAIALGLLAPCLVAYVSLAPGWRRVPAVLVLSALAMLTTTLSTAMNFGPVHALAWATPRVLPALVAGAVTALLLWRLPSRLAAACGLVVLTAGVTLVAHAPQDPYFAASLQLWEQGQFIRFHGMAQWVGWLWPYAAMGWLLGRVAGSR